MNDAQHPKKRLSKAERYLPLSLFTNVPKPQRPEPDRIAQAPIELAGGCLLYSLSPHQQPSRPRSHLAIATSD